MKPINKLLKFLKRSRIILGLSIAVGAVLLMTIVSIWLYNQSGVSRLDLSRPGYKDIIDQIGNDKVSELSFSSNGPIDSNTLADFLELYEKQQQSISAAGDFGDSTMSDKQLKLPTPSE